MKKSIVYMLSLLTLGSTNSLVAKRTSTKSGLTKYEQKKTVTPKVTTYEDDLTDLFAEPEDNPYDGMSKLFDENNATSENNTTISKPGNFKKNSKYKTQKNLKDSVESLTDTRDNIARQGRETLDQSKKAFKQTQKALGDAVTAQQQMLQKTVQHQKDKLNDAAYNTLNAINTKTAKSVQTVSNAVNSKVTGWLTSLNNWLGVPEEENEEEAPAKPARTKRATSSSYDKYETSSKKNKTYRQ